MVEEEVAILQLLTDLIKLRPTQESTVLLISILDQMKAVLSRFLKKTSGYAASARHNSHFATVPLHI